MKQGNVETRDRILLGLYAEYTKDNGCFDHVNERTLELPEDGAFTWNLYKLQTEGFIGGCVFQPAALSGKGDIQGLLRKGLYLTADGVKKAREIAGIPETLDTDGKKHAFLLELIKDIGLTLLAEVIGGK